jgi:hypothetical protein
MCKLQFMMPGSSPSSLPSGMAQWNPWTEQPAKLTVHSPPGLRSALHTTAKCRRTDLKCQMHFPLYRRSTLWRWKTETAAPRGKGEDPPEVARAASPPAERPTPLACLPGRSPLHRHPVFHFHHPMQPAHSVADGWAMHSCPGNRSTYASPMASLSTSAPCAPTSSVTPRSYSSEACAASPRFSLPAGQIQGSTMWGRWPGAVRMN